MAETSITLTRRQLYERVWAVPLRRLCKEFGLSDRGLAKICARHKIPVPARGAWAKKVHGKPARQPPLPSGPSGSDEERRDYHDLAVSSSRLRLQGASAARST